MVGYMGANVADGVDGKIAVAGIFNPAGSGVIFSITSVEVAWTMMSTTYGARQAAQSPALVYQGFDAGYFDDVDQLDGAPRYLLSCDSDDLVPSPVFTKTGNWSPPYPGGYRLFRELWKQVMGDTKRAPFDSPVILKQGRGMLIRSAINYGWMPVSVQGNQTQA